MSPRFLIDTSILSDGTRARPNPGMAARLGEHEDEIATAAPVLHEMAFGVRRLPPSHRRIALERYLDDVVRALPVLPYDVGAAEWHAAERARLAALGRTPPFVDGQIAAIAQTNGLILVTANVAYFKDFAELALEDWRS